MALRLVAKARAEGASKNILTFIGLDDGEHYSPQFRRVRAMSFSISDIVKPSAPDATMVSPALGHRTSTSTPAHSTDQRRRTAMLPQYTRILCLACSGIGGGCACGGGLRAK